MPPSPAKPPIVRNWRRAGPSHIRPRGWVPPTIDSIAELLWMVASVTSPEFYPAADRGTTAVTARPA